MEVSRRRRDILVSQGFHQLELATTILLDLLLALPAALPKGEICGILARRQITIDRLAWDMPAGTLSVEFTSGKDQRLSVRLPKAAAIKAIHAKGARLQEPARPGKTCSVTLVEDRKATLEIGC